MSESIALGDDVRDIISGANGVAVGRAEYLTANVSVLVQPKSYHDGVPRASFWIDERRLERVSSDPHMCGFGNGDAL